MILSMEGYERVSFPTSQGRSRVLFPFSSQRRGGGGATTERKRKREIASRHAYEIDGRSDIKVVPSVRRGATADKWPEMFAKVAGSARQIIFHPCLRAHERANEGERKKEERGL